MPKMDPVVGTSFQAGHAAVKDMVFPDFTQTELANENNLLILTVDCFGKVKMWNNKATPKDQKLKQRGDSPYNTGPIYDIAAIQMGIYANPETAEVEIGVWLPGNPKICGT